MKNPPPLRKSIRNGTLLMLGIAVILGGLALASINRLGAAIREALHRNYVSIEAAQHMHRALWSIQVAEREGQLGTALKPNRQEFEHWIDVEKHALTETGEDRLAKDIGQRGARLFADLAKSEPRESHAAQFAALHSRLDDLIELNSGAMFRADGRASRIGARLTYEFVAGLSLLLIGITLSWTLAHNITKPLQDLAERLRGFNLRGPSLRLREQPVAELQTVATEFNRMAARLEEFEKINVDRLIYEKSKTEAIIESIDDGIVLIDSNGTVTHINEIAAIILGVERADALGSPFDDLNSHHPHYLRIRSALRNAAQQPDAHRIEVELHVRGRDHTYLLKPVPLRQNEGRSFGTILTLQDITYLRDQDRARTNLVATLSHELRTPLTSMALSTGLLERGKDQFGAEEQKLVTAISEDVGRMRNLADDLLDLARGANGSIAVCSVELDFAALVRSVAKTFALQAEHKQVGLAMDLPDSISKVRGDAIKLSWVISNLIANALRYTPEGGRISLDLAESPNRLSFKVRDTGPGIPAEIRDRLFERFSQWSLNGSGKGASGLGLTIVKEIVEAHGGRIFVDTREGEGTCFTVELRTGQEAVWLSC